jgi:hypothetical protein
MPRLPEGITCLPLSDFVAPPDALERWSPAAANPESWRRFKTAEIIFGYDSTTDNAFVVYGRDLLKAVSRFKEPRAVRGIAIELDQSSGQLEYLLALLEKFRGQHDYEADE